MARAKKYKLLYVDDEESNLRVFRNLYRRKFDVVTAPSAKEGLGLFNKQPFDVVISDQRMPDKSGLELLSSIRRKNKLVPTILLTGYADHDVLKEAFNDVGVDKYMNKPFDPKNLSMVVELAAESYRLKKEREEIEGCLKTSESKFRGIFNSIADVFVRVDNKGIIQIISPSIKDLSGHSVDELIGKDVSVLYENPEDRKVLVDSVKKEKFCSGVETVLIKKDGTRKHISSNSKLYYNEKNKPEGIESIVRDISNHKKLEENLRVQGEFLDEVQKMANLGSWQWNLITGEMIWSDTLYKIYGLDQSENQQLSFGTYLSYIHHADRKTVKSTISNAIKKNKSFEFESVINREDGEKRTLSSWGNIIKDGVIQKVTVACIDITEAKLRERAIVESEEKFRILAEQSPIRIYMVNRKLQVEYANELANSMAEVKNEGLQLIHDYFEKESSLIIINSIHEVLEDEKGHYIEFKQNGKKKTKWFALSTSPLKENDNVKAVLLMVDDVTEKKEKENVLRNVNIELEQKVKKRTKALEKVKNDLEIAFEKEKKLGELKSKFVSTASHQFRTPLTVVQANIGLLEMHLKNVAPEVNKKFKILNKRIQAEIKRMTDLMDNVLLLGKKESGTIISKPEMIDLSKNIKSIVRKYNQIQEDGRKIEVCIKGSPSLFHLDPELLDQATSNLVSNAFKYSVGEPSPTVLLEFKKEMATLIIEDYGVGVPEEDLENIFEPFYRASNVDRIAGTGLGTSIAKGYFELMGATISMESELNAGTRFTIKIKK